MTETEALRFYKEAYGREKSRGRALTEKLSVAEQNKAHGGKDCTDERQFFLAALQAASHDVS